jgi:hypothetical protein
MSLNKKLENNLKAYFNYFSNKDIKKLVTLFSNDIRIIDWTSNITGKKNALVFNKKLFSKFKIIKVTLKEKFFNNKNRSFACKISIKLNNKTINVVDLIYFNSKNEIKKIIAYLR